MTRELGVRVERDGEEVRLELTGELDLATAEQAQQAVDEALDPQPLALTVDLSPVSFIDSHGIWLIVECHRRALRGGFPLRVEIASPSVRRALEVAGLDRLVTQAQPAESAGRVKLCLFVSGSAGSSVRAVASARELVERLGPGRAELDVIDVLEDPLRAERSRIIATPTIVRDEPPPPAKLIGEFEGVDALAAHHGIGPLPGARSNGA